MDLIDLMREKSFLGQEFLTWLWYQSEINSGLIDVDEFGSVEVWIEDRLVLETGTSGLRETVICQGRNLDLAEARTALREGKKVTQAKLRLKSQDYEWRLTIKAESLEMTGVRAPKTLDPEAEEAGSEAGRMLDRLAVIRQLIRIMNALYARFLAGRLTESWDQAELPGIRRWLKSRQE